MATPVAFPAVSRRGDRRLCAGLCAGACPLEQGRQRLLPTWLPPPCRCSRTQCSASIWTPKDHRRIAAAGTAHCVVRCLCLTPITGLESHPGTSRMVRANRDLRDVAARALAVRRKNGGEGGDLLGRLVTARNPAAGSALPDSRSIENVVTFLLAGHETTAQALTWTLYLIALFSYWQERAREEIRRVAGDRLIGREPIQQLPLVEAVFSEAMPHLYALARVHEAASAASSPCSKVRRCSRRCLPAQDSSSPKLSCPSPSRAAPFARERGLSSK